MRKGKRERPEPLPLYYHCRDVLALATEVKANRYSEGRIGARETQRNSDAGTDRDGLIQHQADAELRNAVGIGAFTRADTVNLDLRLTVNQAQACGGHDLHPPRTQRRTNA